LEDHVHALVSEVRQLRDDKAALIRREGQLLAARNPSSTKAQSLLLKAARKGDAQAAYEYSHAVLTDPSSSEKAKQRGIKFLHAAAAANVADALALLSTSPPPMREDAIFDLARQQPSAYPKLQAAMSKILAADDVNGDKPLLDGMQSVPWLVSARLTWREQQQQQQQQQEEDEEEPLLTEQQGDQLVAQSTEEQGNARYIASLLLSVE
jgi:hypothetical protein